MFNLIKNLKIKDQYIEYTRDKIKSFYPASINFYYNLIKSVYKDNDEIIKKYKEKLEELKTKNKLEIGTKILEDFLKVKAEEDKECLDKTINELDLKLTDDEKKQEHLISRVAEKEVLKDQEEYFNSIIEFAEKNK